MSYLQLIEFLSTLVVARLTLAAVYAMYNHAPKQLEDSDPKWLIDAKKKFYVDENMLEFEQTLEKGLKGELDKSKQVTAEMIATKPVATKVQSTQDKYKAAKRVADEYQVQKAKWDQPPCPECDTRLKYESTEDNQFGGYIYDTYWCVYCRKKVLMPHTKQKHMSKYERCDCYLCSIAFGAGYKVDGIHGMRTTEAREAVGIPW